MGQTTIRASKNGPYEVKGQPAVVDHEGATYTIADETIYLCRCGQSAAKPFCDGTHKKVGFRAEECVRLTGQR